jgi:hypothetical protein
MPRRNAGDDFSGVDLLRDYGAGTYKGTFADCYSTDNDGAAADRCAFPDKGLLTLPIQYILKRAIFVSCTRMSIIYEHHAMTNKALILDRYAFADETMRADLTFFADFHAILNFDERPDPRMVPEFTAVDIAKAKKPDAFAELYVVGDEDGLLLCIEVLIHGQLS